MQKNTGYLQPEEVRDGCQACVDRVFMQYPGKGRRRGEFEQLIE